MTQIKKVKTSEGVQFYPQTHTKAVIDDNGYTAESRLGAMQDEINQAQLEVGAVPSDLTPTEDSTNWVTSGGVYNAIQGVHAEVTGLSGKFDYTENELSVSRSITLRNGITDSNSTSLGLEANTTYRVVAEFSKGMTKNDCAVIMIVPTASSGNNAINITPTVHTGDAVVEKIITTDSANAHQYLRWYENDQKNTATVKFYKVSSNSLDIVPKLYDSIGQNSDGAINQETITKLLTKGIESYSKTKDVNDFQIYNGRNNSGVWDTSYGKFFVIPTVGLDSIYLGTPTEQSLYWALLKSFTEPVSGGAIDFCDGFSGNQSIGPNVSTTVSFPDDCNYLLVFRYLGASNQYNVTPSSIVLNFKSIGGGLNIEERLAALENSQIKTYSNPVCAVDFSDPTVWDGEDGYYYALATGSVTGRTMKRSANLVDWEDTNDLPYTSDVADTILSNFGSSTSYWAPCVYKVKEGQWNLYLTKPSGGIAFLTSKYPTYGYEFVKYTTASFGDYIDPDVARDRDGSLWMFAGSADMMHRRQMTDNGLDFAENSSWEHVAGRPSGESGNTNRIKTFEGGCLYRRGGYWYLFCSSGQYYNRTYAIRVVRSQTLDGTFVDKEGNLATEGYAETIMSSGSSLYGPGHNSQIFVDSNGKTWMLYHSHWTGMSSSAARPMCIDEVLWDEDGWPYFDGGVPSLTHAVPNM